MNYTVELNSARKDADYVTSQLNAKSPVVEVFSAMASGTDVGAKYGAKADKVVNHIKSLAEKADMGDFHAVAELNTIRRFAIEPKLMEEIKLMGIFGTYQNVGYGESIEREVYAHEGSEMSRMQALSGDVPFPTIVSKKYPVSTVSIGAGYAVDYRKIQLGDMSKENEAMEQIKVDIRNKASKYAINTIYNAVKNATGVKYFSETSGITKAALDDMLAKVRRFGVPTITGDYAVVSQINNFVPYDNGTVKGIASDAMEEIRKNTFIRMYNGSVVAEIPNGYDLTTRNSDGTNFGTILPEGLLFLIPTGTNSPVMSWTRGGLTSFTGNDVSTGKVLTRYDLEFAVDVAKGQEYKIALLADTNFDLPTV